MAQYDPVWSLGESKLINSSGVTVGDGDDIWVLGEDKLYHEYNVTGTAYTSDLADNVGITDTIEISVGYNKTITDTVGITDTVSTAVGYVKVIVNNIGITDAIAKVAGYSKTIANTIGITDTLSKVVGYSKTITNTVGITDTLSRVATYVRIITNTVGITDAISRVVTYIRSISNNVGITDAVTASKVLFVNIANTVGITDAISAVTTVLTVVAKVIGTITKYLINAVMSKHYIMSEGGNMEIKKGNTGIFDFALKDGDGVIISTLASAQTVVFQLKDSDTGTVLIEKDLNDGVTVDRDKNNNVVTGSVRVEISASETNGLTADSELSMALEVTWANNTQEVYIKESTCIVDALTINQDIVIN